MKKESNISVSEFNNLIESGKAQILTLAKAKELKGHRIAWTYFGDNGNVQSVYETIVGEVESTFDHNKHIPYDLVMSTADYWEKYKNQNFVDKMKNEIMIADQLGNNTFMYCYPHDASFDEPTFTCSDSDRPVFFIEL